MTTVPLFPAQISPKRMNVLTRGERLHRLAALATEVYGGAWREGLVHHMRVTPRTVWRWYRNEGPVPRVVLVSLGAMVQAKRSGV